MPSTSPNPDLHRIWMGAVLAALCPLIPIPLVDDLALDLVRKMTWRAIFQAHGVEVSDAQVKILLTRPSNRLLGCVRALVFYPLKKLFRKVFYFLSVKDAVDAGSGLLHEGWLLRHAMEKGLVDPTWSERPDADWQRLGAALRTTCAATDTRPLNQGLRRAFRGSKKTLRTMAAVLADVFRTKGNDAVLLQDLSTLDHPTLQVLAREVEQVAFLEPGYLHALEHRFEVEFGK